ncbi:MAG: prepilin-type N-terminal cleavage/methylation domain-containing protein [Synergistaceae bacterium]|jgi:prepilin-type N-terminal cleavage/methylation domain-containing protein|nr:prepilin-type N-terminal cleavage/methylation domain-containing protein [Synergistaceae bacterium]
MPFGNGCRDGFTLIEVMVAVAIIGLVTAAGFKLLTLSFRTLAEVKMEQELMNEAQKVRLDFLTKEDMSDSGEKDGVKWSVDTDSVPVVDGLELTFRRLTVEYQDRKMVLYLPGTQ